MLSCLKAIADVKMEAFTKILSTAILEVAKVSKAHFIFFRWPLILSKLVGFVLFLLS